MIHVLLRRGLRTKLEFFSSPWSLLLTKILLLLILIDLRSVFFCIRAHLSFRRIDSTSLSSLVISRLIRIPFGSELVLDNKVDTSMALLKLTRIGRGREDCSWYFPRRRRSRIDKGLTFSSTLVIVLATLLRSSPERSCLGVPFGHSSIP